MDLYQYKGCGLPNVYLQNGCEKKRTAYGDAVAIHNVEGLHEAIADHLVLKPGPLTADEFRYLRVFLEMSQKKLGELFGISDQTVQLREGQYRHGPRSGNAPADARS